MKWMRRRGWRSRLLLLAAFWLLDLALLPWLTVRAVVGNLNLYTAESEAFREQSVSPAALEQVREVAAREGKETGEVLAVFLAAGRMELTESQDISSEEYYRLLDVLLCSRKEELLRLQDACCAVWNDLSCFPTAADSGGGTVTAYENTWMGRRTYQGERRHEGCDVFCYEAGQEGETLSGYYPVVSVTDGYVEKIGWLTLGGWRIGIRSRSGGYFYYAHLDSYARDFQVGDAVSAGEVLGFMGDSGYGDEGTVGQFPVHLHFGIYFTTDEGKEISINPYAALMLLEGSRREYDFS